MRDSLKFFLVVMIILSSCSDDSLRIKKVIVKDNSARLIDNPKTKSPITFIPIGTELEVLKIKDVKKGLFNTTWFQVAFEDTIGWINMFFVTVDSNATIEDMKKIIDRANLDDDDNNLLDEEISSVNETGAYNDTSIIDKNRTNNNLVMELDSDIEQQQTIKIFCCSCFTCGNI